MRPKKKLVLTAKILLSLFILGYLFYLIPLNEIIHSAFSADPVLFSAALLLIIPINYLSALETRYLTGIQGLDLSVWEILKIHLATGFYAFFLPGTLSGGAVKWYKFSKFGKKSSAAAVVVLNRFLEVLMIVFMGILFSFPVLYEEENSNLIAALLIILILMNIVYWFLMSKKGLDFVNGLIFNLPLPALLKKPAGKFSAAMLEFRKMSLKEHLEIFGLLFLYHAAGVLSFFLFARSLDINLSIWIFGWIRSAMSLAIMIPLSFAGLGIREGTLVLLLGRYGINPDVSMALSFLFFSKDILISLAGGLLELKDFTLTGKLKRRNTLNSMGEG